MVYQTAEEPDDFLARHAQHSEPFQGRASWMGLFPVEEKQGQDARETRGAVSFVDVGGVMGHEAAAVLCTSTQEVPKAA